MKPVLIVGIGNAFRGDDAVGLLVARKLREADLPGVTVVEHHREGTSLLALWEEAPEVILVDAAASGSEPGTIHRWEASGHAIPTAYPARLSGHGIGVGEALELARQLGRLPSRIVVYGIEAGSFALGSDVTPPVFRGAQAVADRICRELEVNGNVAGSAFLSHP